MDSTYAKVKPTQRKGIGLVVVVAERHVRFTDILKSHSESSFIAYYADLAELDGGKRVGYDGECGKGDGAFLRGNGIQREGHNDIVPQGFLRQRDKENDCDRK